MFTCVIESVTLAHLLLKERKESPKTLMLLKMKKAIIFLSPPTIDRRQLQWHYRMRWYENYLKIVRLRYSKIFQSKSPSIVRVFKTIVLHSLRQKHDVPITE